MKFYFAPMEGITGYIYRNAHHAFCGKNVDKYFAPFINANLSESFKSRELNDIFPENNKDINLIPQIMTNRAKDFLHTSSKLHKFGYEEINLNLGCPSKTVVTKYRGSGFLAKPKELKEFLDEVFESKVTQISIKTRIGMEDPEEFYALMDIYNQFPIKELIIHPRLQADYYNNKPNLFIFEDALKLSKNPICYNGDIHTLIDYQKLIERFPTINTVMLGRGLLYNPFLICQINGKEDLDKNQLWEFHNKIYTDYQSVLFGEKNVLFKMKEFWHYFGHMFSNPDKYVKKIKKAQKLYEYDAVVKSIFKEETISCL
ncbi:MAG: tRNA-dihydrouridine synthase family protein [Candidatus Galacturonibacter soehngenii]|nr:tRNA-dihydrouridine synthase family protein [Candidatus Galacturonibacter soehngenii]